MNIEALKILFATFSTYAPAVLHTLRSIADSGVFDKLAIMPEIRHVIDVLITLTAAQTAATANPEAVVVAP